MAIKFDFMSLSVETSHGNQEIMGGQTIYGSPLKGNNLQQNLFYPRKTKGGMMKNGK
jgi:hypothetical protein